MEIGSLGVFTRLFGRGRRKTFLKNARRDAASPTAVSVSGELYGSVLDAAAADREKRRAYLAAEVYEAHLTAADQMIAAQEAFIEKRPEHASLAQALRAAVEAQVTHDGRASPRAERPRRRPSARELGPPPSAAH